MNRRRNKAMVLIIAMWSVAIMVVLAIAIAGTVFMAQGQLRTIRTENLDELATGSAVAVVCTNLTGQTKNLSSPANFPLEINGVDVTLKDNVIQSEAARLNANTATADMLARLSGMNSAAATKFIAARDRLAELRAGLKSDTTANWPIANPMELARLLYAATASKYVASSSASAGADWYASAGISDDIAAIMKNLTLYSRQLNTDAKGLARVNINTASPATLTSRLGDELTANQTEAIVQSRANNHFENIVELLTRQYNPIIDGKTVQLTITAEKFRKIADRVTTTDTAMLVGLIDVSAASQDVLRTLPGISESDVSAITSWQQFKASADDLASQGIAALLDAVSPQTLAQISPYITTRCDQYRCVLTKTTTGRLDLYTVCIIEQAGNNFGTLFRYDWSVFASAGNNQQNGGPGTAARRHVVL